MAPIPQTDDDGRDRQPPEDHQHCDVEDVETPNFVINVAAESSDSDENDDIDDNHGYQLLPQELREDDDSSGDDDDDDDVDDGEPVEDAVSEVESVNIENISAPDSEVDTSKAQVPDLPVPNKQDLLWNQERCGQVSNMNQDHLEKIKSAMSNFQLPVSHIPEWAKNISDDQWEKNMVMKLKQEKPTKSSETENTKKLQAASSEHKCS